MRMSLYDPVFLDEISTLFRMNLKFLYNIYNYIFIVTYCTYIHTYIYISIDIHIFFQLHPDLGTAWGWTAVSSVWWSAEKSRAAVARKC